MTAIKTIIIGSANLTENALMRNYEWSLQVNSLNNGDITRQVSENIEDEWRNAQPLTDQWIAQYQLVLSKESSSGSCGGQRWLKTANR
jgi:HKD family nuclease